MVNSGTNKARRKYDSPHAEIMHQPFIDVILESGPIGDENFDNEGDTIEF